MSQQTIITRITFFVLSIISFLGFAQDTTQSKLNVQGYLSFLQSSLVDDIWIINNQFHNRLNFDYYASDAITLHTSLRSRLMYGDYNRLIPHYEDSFEEDKGYVDLSFVPASNRNYLLTSQMDRLYGEWNKGKWQVSAGRQRINWGQCTVWNPNDVLNTYSYFDVDYIERPGSDALRVTYYLNFASQIELVSKVAEEGKMTYAGLYKFNKWNYDIQVLAAYLEEKEVAVGAGTMGYIGSNSIRAEYTYLHPVEDGTSDDPVSLFSIGMDRLCKKDLFLQAEFLYNSYADEVSPDVLTGIYSQPTSIKELSFDRYSALAGAQYPITPLFNSGLSGMYYVNSNAYYISPSLTYSLKSNLDISLIGQYFNLEVFDKRDGYATLFWSLKQSF